MPIHVSPRLVVFLVLGSVIAPLLLGLHTPFAQNTPTTNPPTFYRDVLPILERHCQGCHRTGGIAPMPFETYEETRPFAEAIRRAVQEKSMPPWFADPNVGKFSNDPSLSPSEIATLAAWVAGKSPAGASKKVTQTRPLLATLNPPQP